MEFLDKLRKLPESQRKIILWAVTIIVGLALFLWWANYAKKQIGVLQTEDLKEGLRLPEFPKVETPSFEFPQDSQEELRQLEEALQQENKEYRIKN